METGMSIPSAPERQAKHMDILSAIARLSQVEKQVKRLLDKITGDEPVEKDTGLLGCEAKVKSSSPTLLDVLNTAGNNIAERSEGISNKLNLIEELIF